MIKTVFGALALAAVAASAPAAAVTTITFSYTGGSAITGSSVVRTNSGVTLTATAKTFTVAPSTLTGTNVSALTAAQTRLTAPGLGVFGSSNGNLDTNLVDREAILFSGSRYLSLAGAVLNNIDNNDSLRVYGVNGQTGVLELVGYNGSIISGLAGAATFTNDALLNNNTTTLNFVTSSAYYKEFLFTTRIDGTVQPQGYRIADLTFAVPEPATWGLMLVGFGLVGVAARRRSRAVAA
jgi:hypothetical protein